MTRFLDQLEGRTLFTATPTTLWNDELAMAKDSKAALVAFRNVMPAARVDLLAIRADLLALPNKPANLKLFNRLVTDANKGVAKVIGDCAKTVAISTRAMTRIFADELKLQYKPNSEILKAKLTGDLGLFSGLLAVPAAKLTSDLTGLATNLQTDIATLAAANPTAPQLNTDLQKLGTDGQTSMTSVQTALDQGGADLTKLITDLLT